MLLTDGLVPQNSSNRITFNRVEQLSERKSTIATRKFFYQSFVFLGDEPERNEVVRPLFMILLFFELSVEYVAEHSVENNRKCINWAFVLWVCRVDCNVRSFHHFVQRGVAEFCLMITL